MPLCVIPVNMIKKRKAHCAYCNIFVNTLPSSMTNASLASYQNSSWHTKKGRHRFTQSHVDLRRENKKETISFIFAPFAGKLTIK